MVTKEEGISNGNFKSSSIYRVQSGCNKKGANHPPGFYTSCAISMTTWCWCHSMSSHLSTMACMFYCRTKYFPSSPLLYFSKRYYASIVLLKRNHALLWALNNQKLQNTYLDRYPSLKRVYASIVTKWFVPRSLAKWLPKVPDQRKIGVLPIVNGGMVFRSLLLGFFDAALGQTGGWQGAFTRTAVTNQQSVTSRRGLLGW